jgi:hypothetical protein
VGTPLDKIPITTVLKNVYYNARPTTYNTKHESG